MIFDFLKKVPLFADLTEEDLKRICKDAQITHLSAGEVLFKEGDIGDKAYVIKDGELEISKREEDREVILAVRKKGELIGEIALLEDTPRSATVKALTNSTLIAIRNDQFEELFKISTQAPKTILKTALKRWRENEALLRQSEKMAQLGVLTAGIAHELNNPASAVQRSAGSVLQLIAESNDLLKAIVQNNYSPTQRQVLNKYERKVSEKAKLPLTFNSLERSDKEEEARVWLEKKGFTNAQELAYSLSNVDFRKSELEELTKNFKDKNLELVISWLCNTYEVQNLLNEIKQGAARISEIVKALKDYTYLDQAPIQEIDIHKGIDNTLLILRNKLKTGITVEKIYDKAIPKIEGYGSELNQVWTNLIDNAADALNGKGKIIIRTKHDDSNIYVEIEDNGSGIPKDIQEKVFDPFFTTKEPGKGTGLGLDISYNIVVHRHKGEINFNSSPGKTVFFVKLPIRFQRV